MSDYGHEQTDIELKKLEKRLAKEYSEATKDLEKKFEGYMKNFARKDEQMKKLVDSGKLKEEDYENWRRNQLIIGERWKDMYDTLAKDLANVDQIAAGMINETLPSVYALNMNYGTYEVEKGCRIDTGFNLYSRETVENMMKNEPNIIPKLTEGQKKKIEKDELWNRKKLVSAVTQGILQGESIPKIAERLGSVAKMDFNASRRNARTYTTAAENKGRMDSYERADKMGIQVKKKWIATLDDRTRVEHRHLDGMVVPYQDLFEMDGYEIMFPGDPDAEPEMIYNCRCTLVAEIPGIQYQDERYDEKLGGMSYEEWKHAKDKPGKEGIVEEKKEEKKKSEFEFIPAKSIPEAEEYAKNFVDGNGFGALGISYKGIGLDVANEINRTLAELYGKYNISKFGGVFVPKGNSKLGQMISNAHAAYSPVRNSFLIRNTLKSLEFVEKELRNENDVISKFIANPNNYDTSKMSKTVYKVLMNSRESGRGTVPENVKDIITHEFGHSLEKAIKNSSNYEKISSNMEEYAPKISGYATESVGEYIAESFCSYQRGEEIVDKELIKAFEGLER